MNIALLCHVVKIHLIYCSCTGCNNAIMRHDCQSTHHVRSSVFNVIGWSQSLLGNFSKYSTIYTVYFFAEYFPLLTCQYKKYLFREPGISGLLLKELN